MNKMTRDEMIKYSAELVVKNNQDEAVKLLVKLEKDNKELLKTYDDLEEQYKSLMKDYYRIQTILNEIINFCNEVREQNIDIEDTDFEKGEDSLACDILHIIGE